MLKCKMTSKKPNDLRNNDDKMRETSNNYLGNFIVFKIHKLKNKFYIENHHHNNYIDPFK